MRIAKNRATIEDNIRNGVADLTLGQAAALMMMTADMKKVLNFVKQIETTDDPEKIITLAMEHGYPVIHTPGYDPFANCTEDQQREWYVFMLFLVKHEGAVVNGGVADHIEWILQKQFKTVEEWLGPEGNKFCWWRHPIKAEFIEIWRAFAAEHASLTIADINAELGRIHAYQEANPQPAITKRRRRA